MTGIALLILVSSISLAVMLACVSGNTVWAASTVMSPTSNAPSSHSGPVIQEQVNTGNAELDKQISKFYSCISKTHLDPPTIQVVDGCYSQQQIAGVTAPGTVTHNPNKLETHPIDTTPKQNTVNPPPGILVEVP
jgi:hypothetical protein